MKKTIATTPDYQIIKETSTIIKNVVLEGVKTLKADKVITIFEVTHKLQPNTNKPYKIVDKKQVDEFVVPLSFNLKKVTPKELAVYRKKNIPSLVIKINDNLYYTSIPEQINFVSSSLLGTHRCGASGHECNRLSAASDKHGGCAKVRNKSSYIERYSWITTGYETFNTNHDSFVVINCSHYEPCPPKKTLSVDESNRAKLGLAQFIWDDVTSHSQIRERIDANRRKNGMTY